MFDVMTKACALGAFVLLATSSAQAQKFSDVAQQLDSPERTVMAQQSRGVSLRVQVTYQLQLTVGHAQSLDDQKTAIADVHAAIYDLASHECDQLKSIAAGDCRLAALSVGDTAYRQVNPAGTFQASATATFEVTPPTLPATNQAPAPKP